MELPRVTHRVVTCRSKAEAEAVLDAASRILSALGVSLNLEKTRIVHVRRGFEFLGYKIKQGKRPLRLSAEKIRSGTVHGQLYAYPRQKSINHFKEQIRSRTFRRVPVTTMELIAQVNPVIRGWGQYFCKAHVRGLFHRLDGWIVRRIWSHRYKRWRCKGWKTLPSTKLYGEMGLVNLISLIPSLRSGRTPTFVKAGCGKTARPV